MTHFKPYYYTSSIFSLCASLLSAQTVIFEDQFDGAENGYNEDSANASVGEDDWVDFANRITTNSAGNEGYFTATGGTETVLTGAANGNDPQVRSDFPVGITQSDVGKIELRARIDNDQNGNYDDLLNSSSISLFWGSNSYVNPGAANGNPNVSITLGPADSVQTESDGWTLFVWNDAGGLFGGAVGSTMVNSFRIDPVNNNIGASFEIDFIKVTQSTLVSLDPTTPIPPEFNLREEWNWNTDGDLEEWTVGANNHFTVSGVVDGLLRGMSTDGDAQLLSPSILIPDVTSGRFIVEIGLKTNPGDNSSKRLFWALDGMGFDPDQAITFPLIPDDGNEHVIRLSLDDLINAPITRLRYDPSAEAGISSQLNFMRVYSAGSEISTGAPEITAFSYDPQTGNALVSLKGQASTAYSFFSTDDLDFSDSELLFILGTSVGSLDGDGVQTDANGDASVELLMDLSPKKFVRAQQ